MTPLSRSIPDSALILGIESSCDETAAAVVRCDSSGTYVLSNIIASQNELHEEYRGVVPEIASRAHAERLLPVVRQAIQDARISLHQISAVAVGNRPGLIGCLLVGVSGAKALAWALGVPFIGIDHVQAHLYAPCLREPRRGTGSAGEGFVRPRFPAIGLVVSGGHTALYRCDSPTRLRRIGSTIDDAVGEAYDKAASILGLGFPGGPALDRLAQTGNPVAMQLPISRLGAESLDFSFSGLKTSLLYAAKGVPVHPSRAGKPLGTPGAGPTTGLAVPASGLSHADLAASFQSAAMQAVMIKVRRALEQNPDCRTLFVGGGVSANSRLREELVRLGSKPRTDSREFDVRIPPMAYCLDNAAMIAGLAWHVLIERNWAGDDLSMSAQPMSGIEQT